MNQSFDGLQKTLLITSQELIQQSLIGLEEKNEFTFLLFANSGLEHLSKCALIRINPTLLVDATRGNRGEQALLYFSGSQKIDFSQISTISLRIALDRLVHFDVLKTSYLELLKLIDARNNFIHIGTHTEIHPRIIVSYIQAIEEILSFLEEDSKIFWSPRFDLSRSLLDTSLSQLHSIVLAKLAKSKKFFQSNFGSQFSANTDAVMPLLSFDEELHACPTCNSMAIFSGDYDFEYEEDWDEDGFSGIHAINGKFRAQTLFCPICKLQLGSREELKIAGVETDFDTEETPETLGWLDEIDEDVYRGR